MPDKAFGQVSRAEWSARPSKLLAKLSNPVSMVRFVLRTTAEECLTKESCTKAVQEIQKEHQYDWRLPDINYNFLIGGDKNVYECRGWTYQISRLPSHSNSKVLNILTIGYIGDFSGTKIPEEMQDTAYTFIRHFITEGKIHPGVLEPPNRIRLSSTL